MNTWTSQMQAGTSKYSSSSQSVTENLQGQVLEEHYQGKYSLPFLMTDQLVQSEQVFTALP